MNGMRAGSLFIAVLIIGKRRKDGFGRELEC
jgi:hypothetical protein